MSECPECGMRDDDWFLCRRDKCPIGVKSGVAAEIARLQEQVEAQLAETQRAWNERDGEKRGRLAAEAERDRLREALEPFAEAWDAAVHHEDLVRHLTLGQLGELAAHEVSGVHFRRARAALKAAMGAGR